MSELGSIFNPGEAEMTQHLNSERTLPAPSPTADAPPLETADGDEVYIPALSDLPGAAVLPTPVRAAHRPDGTPNAD